MALSCCKKLFGLFCKITLKHDGEFYCLNCLHSFSIKTKLKKYEYLSKRCDCCYIEMPNEENILKYNNGEMSMKVPFITYADMESLLKIYTCHNNFKKSSTTKKISIKPLVIHCLHIVHLMSQKTNMIIIQVNV